MLNWLTKIWSKIRPGGDEKEAKIFRVATFNLHYSKKPEKILKILRENPALQLADILLFQEVENVEGFDRAKYLAKELSLHYVYAPAWTKTERSKMRTHGLATLSRFPIKKHEVVALDYFSLGFRSRERIALNTVIELPNGDEILVSNVHLDTRINTNERVKQMESVLAAVRKWPQTKIIIAGDLNTIPLYWLKRSVPVFFANPRKHIDKLLFESGFASHIPHARTQRSFVRFRLDGIYTKGLESVRTGIEKSVKVSDHLPIWEDLR